MNLASAIESVNANSSSVVETAPVAVDWKREMGCSRQVGLTGEKKSDLRRFWDRASRRYKKNDYRERRGKGRQHWRKHIVGRTWAMQSWAGLVRVRSWGAMEPLYPHLVPWKRALGRTSINFDFALVGYVWCTPHVSRELTAGHAGRGSHGVALPI